MNDEPSIEKVDDTTVKETVTIPQELTYTLDEILGRIDEAKMRKIRAEDDIVTWQAKADAARSLGVKTQAEIIAELPTDPTNLTEE